MASNGIIFKSYVQGSYFGEVDILENRRRDCSVLAAVDSEILVINKRQFCKMIDQFPYINQ